jgi:serine/threonine-protein kinase
MAVVLAVRNVRMRRGDLKGATRLSLFFFCMLFARWLLTANHLSGTRELDLLLTRLSFIVMASAAVWSVYVALEPLLRRRWPRTLVSWNRLLAGRFRDPLVGRDLLAGITAWWVFVVLSIPLFWAPRWFDLAPQRPEWRGNLTALLGPTGVGASFIDSLLMPIVVSTAYLFLLLLLCTVLRKMWLAVVVVFLLESFGSLLSIPTNPAQELISVAQNLLYWGILFLLISRFGLLSLCVWAVSSVWALNTAVGPASAGWYQGVSHFFTLASAALLLYAIFITQRRPGRASSLGEGVIPSGGGS